MWTVLGLVAWFDHPVAGVQRAEFFGWLVPFLTSVGKEVGATLATLVLEGVKGAIAALGGAVRWLIGQVRSFLVSTGAMFAKVWRSLEGFWNNVIRKALLYLHDQYIRLRNWLRYIFKPLIAWLDKIRDKIHEIYRRFVRPILDGLDTARRVLAILAKLHIPFAAQLEGYLAKTEQWIVDRYNQLNNDLNKVRDTLNGILTLDGFLQRFLFLRTMERDVFYVYRALNNAHARPLTAAEYSGVRDKAKGVHLSTVQADLGQYLTDGSGDLAPQVADASAAWDGYFANVNVDDTTTATG